MPDSIRPSRYRLPLTAPPGNARISLVDIAAPIGDEDTAVNVQPHTFPA